MYWKKHLLITQMLRLNYKLRGSTEDEAENSNPLNHIISFSGDGSQFFSNYLKFPIISIILTVTERASLWIIKTPLWLRMKVKEESEKVDLKLNIQKTKIMASGPIISWKIDGETMETVTDLIFWGCKITADGDWSHEIKRHLCLGRKAMTKLDRILKSRHITLPTTVHLVKAMVFPVVTYGCESWTIKKAEHRRIDAFELWCWRRLFRVPWTARKANLSILKEISPEYSLEGQMLKLKLQYFVLPEVKNWLNGKDPDAGKDWRGQEDKGMTEDEMVGWHHRLNGHEFE